jgi:peroxiredoxin
VPGTPGEKGLLLNLWSKDCLNCRNELKAWSGSVRKWEKAGVSVSAWCVDGTQAEAEATAKKQGFTFPVLSAQTLKNTLPAAELMGALNAIQKGCLGLQQDMPVPVTFLLDARRRLVAIYKGPVHPEQLTRDFSLLTATDDARRKAACPDQSGRWREPISPVGLRAIVAALLDDKFKDAAEKLLLACVDAYGQAGMSEFWKRTELSAAQNLLGLWELERKNLKGAEARYKASLAARANAEARRGLVNTWMLARQKELYPEIGRQLEQLVRETSDPGDMGKLGVLRLEFGDAAGAAKLLRDSLAAVPDATNYFQLGQAQRALGDAAGAAASWKESIRLKPDFLPPLNNLALLRATHRDSALRDGLSAVAMAESAVKLSGGRNPVALGTLSAALAEAGKFEEAVAAAGRAEEMASAAGQKELAAKFAGWRAQFQKREPFRE